MSDNLVLLLCWIMGGIAFTVFYYRMWGQKNICKKHSLYLEEKEWGGSSIGKRARDVARGEAGFILVMPFMWWIMLILIAILWPMLTFGDWLERKFPTNQDRPRPFLDWFINRSCGG